MKRSRRLSIVNIVLILLRIGVAVGVVLGTWATLSAGHLSAGEWRDLLIFGIAQGSVYALIALGYTLVYGVLLHDQLRARRRLHVRRHDRLLRRRRAGQGRLPGHRCRTC